jgi:phospholipid/cholesterol/gamma-HCH transport system ATP-binding protein
MNDESIIKVDNLKVSYSDTVILNDINFEIKRGEIVCIVGGSGCGKSTLLRQIIGLEEPAEGEIFIFNEKFYPASVKTRMKIIKKFGVMFQMSGLIASMNLKDNIELLLKTYTKLNQLQIDETVSLKLNSVGLNGYEDFLPSEISGGMKKRAALARAMALDPEILFFDEPSSGLDPSTAASLDKLIKEINASLKTTMVIVTHDLSSIYEIADKVILLDKSLKGILAIDTPENLKKSSDSRIYNFFNRKSEMESME